MDKFVYFAFNYIINKATLKSTSRDTKPFQITSTDFKNFLSFADGPGPDRNNDRVAKELSCGKELRNVFLE